MARWLVILCFSSYFFQHGQRDTNNKQLILNELLFSTLYTASTVNRLLHYTASIVQLVSTVREEQKAYTHFQVYSLS